MPANCDKVIQDLLGMIDRATLPAIRQYGLDEMVRLTGSRLGFYATVDDTQKSAKLSLVSPAAAADLAQPHFHTEGLAPASYWYDCVARREAVLRNEAVPCAAPGGAPDPGPLQRDLTVPVLDGGRIVAVIGVADRTTPYGAHEAQLLQELAAGLYRVIVRKRLRDSLEDPHTP